MSLRTSRLFVFVLAIGFPFIAALSANAQEFYKGKTITIIVGTAAGGGAGFAGSLAAADFS